MWLLWDSFSVKWTWTKSFQCYKIMLPLFEVWFSFTSPHPDFFFSSHHSSPLLTHTLMFWPNPSQTHLLADPIHSHARTYIDPEKKTSLKYRAHPVFLHLLIGSFISSNAVSLTWSTNRKHCCENGVLMFTVPACSVLNQTLTGHCNGFGFKGSRFLGILGM